MSSFSPEQYRTYFGFNDVAGFKDFVVYVLSCAPDLFPAENWLKPDEQMNLERAFIGLRYGLEMIERQRGGAVSLIHCRKLVEDAFAAYSSGEDHAGQMRLEQVEEILTKLRSN